MENVAVGKVVEIGFEFFVHKQPQKAFPIAGLTHKDVLGVLLAQGHSQLSPAYRVAVETEAGAVTFDVGMYHTRRVFGTEPTFKVGDAVEVHKLPNPKVADKFVFALKVPVAA